MQSSVPYVLYIHSILRYFILIFAAVVSVQCLIGMLQKKRFAKSNRMPALLLLIFCDMQLLLGFVLYYYKMIASNVLGSGNVMGDTYKRFFGVEHSVSMIIAIVLVHVGYSITKKNIAYDRKFKRLFWCSFVALAIFMAMTPWAAKQVVGRPNVPVMPS